MVHGCGGDGEWVAPEGDEAGNRVGGDAGNMKDTSGRLDIDQSSGEKRMTGEREDERRRHLDDRERSGRVGIE